MRPASAFVLALLLLQPRPVPQTLAVLVRGEWHTWWQNQHAPVRWSAALPLLNDALEWHAAGQGLDWGELDIAAPGEAWRTKVVVVRIEPRRYRFDLRVAIGDRGTTALWTIDAADSAAAFAINAGQFEGASPWGWVLHHGREARPPRHGPLSSAIVFDSAGAATLVDYDDIEAVRAAGNAIEAFQSYPTLLTGQGDVPPPLRTGTGIDILHRDARVAIGELRDGRLLFVLTRFNGLRGVAASAPLGLTIPEMAALMGALGCRRAVSLDGGLSSQMRVRAPGGVARDWRGWRNVPMGLVATPR